MSPDLAPFAHGVVEPLLPAALFDPVDGWLPA